MQKLVIGMRDKRGFTLIEIMIVIVIMGITFGFALIAFGDFGESKRLLFAAEQLSNTIRLAQQQAILESSTLGVSINNEGYRIMQLQNNAQWTPLSNSNFFKMTYFPNHTSIILNTNHRTVKGSPSIIITAAGSLTPFTLHFNLNKEEKIAVLTGSRNGDLKLQKFGAE